MQSEMNGTADVVAPISLLFEFVSGIRQQLLPSIFAIFSAARGGAIGLWVAVIFFSLSMMYAVFRYATFRYQFRNGELVVDQGSSFECIERCQCKEFKTSIWCRMSFTAFSGWRRFALRQLQEQSPKRR